LVALLTIATPLVGLPVASFVFAAVLLRRAGMAAVGAVLAALALCIVQLVLLGAVFDVLVEREVVGRIAWALLGY
jgi:hypothetical protein